MIHFHPVPRNHFRADVRARESAYVKIHHQLRDELEEQRISALLVAAHNEKIARHRQASNEYRQTADL